VRNSISNCQWLSILLLSLLLQLEFNSEFDPISQAVAHAQEQLCLVMEVKWAEDLWQWMEKGWENWMAEQDSVVV